MARPAKVSKIDLGALQERFDTATDLLREAMQAKIDADAAYIEAQAVRDNARAELSLAAAEVTNSNV
jgi:hypothetical protein